MTRGLSLALVVLLCAIANRPLPAQVRQAVVESVDLTVPTAPAAVRVAGRTTLVYELHLTNFLLTA